LVLTPNDEGAPGTNVPGAAVQGINRYADSETGTQWLVHLERADGQPVGGVLVASMFCFYPLGR
jgi:hypothetical protein